MAQYEISVQVYSLGPYGVSKHSALEFSDPNSGYSICFEVSVVRKFQCALCDDCEWRLSGGMEHHFRANHSGHRWEADSGRFAHGVFHTDKRFQMNIFNGHNSCCSGAKLKYTDHLGSVQLSPEQFESLRSKWIRNLDDQKYDEAANNCNHQVDHWCNDLRHLGIKQPNHFINLPARLAFAWFGPVR